jgi:hypothetical protein
VPAPITNAALAERILALGQLLGDKIDVVRGEVGVLSDRVATQNGRVTALEQHNIAEGARDSERSRVRAREDARDARRLGWRVAGLWGIAAAVVGGAITLIGYLAATGGLS